MADHGSDERVDIRELARSGSLAATFAQAPAATRRRLWQEGYELLHPIVFNRLTRRVEARRGHRDCMMSIGRLRPDCLDRFHDDMEAVLSDLFRNARRPIYNLEGWVDSRLVRSTVDAYRRRRSRRGALQRPRIPRWLALALHHDERLLGLAVEMLEWVGVEATAGAEDWPVEAWAAQRAAEIGDYETARRAVLADIATVLTAMRTKPPWYQDYVERPLGHKQLPLALPHRSGCGPGPDQPPTALERGVADDNRRAELAALAVDVIAARLARGDDAKETVVEVIGSLFGAGTAAETMDRAPGQGGDDGEVVDACLADPGTVDRVVAVVLDLLGQ